MSTPQTVSHDKPDSSTHHDAPREPRPNGAAATRAARLHLPFIELAIDGRLLLASAAAGAVAGLIAVLYHLALSHLLGGLTWVEHHGLPVWALMPIAGLLIGLCYKLGNPGETDELVNDIHVENGRMNLRANLPLIPISLLSIAAGGSAGPEAPMVHLTGSAGTLLHKWLKLPEESVRPLTFAGMSVGFATLFGAPVGSTLFALEIPHRRGMEYYEALLPALVGCLVGYSIFSGFTHHGIGYTWTLPHYQFRHYTDLGYALLVGLVCGAFTLPYVWLIRAMRKIVRAVKGAPKPLLGAAGGLVLGLVAWKLPLTRYWGEDQLKDILPGQLLLAPLLLLAIAKMFTVSTTLASGWKGGIIIPCFLIGGCLGKALALVVPGLDPSLAVVCGMAAVNIAVMKVPLGTVIVVVTMCGINAIGPVTVAALASFIISGGINVIDTKRERTPSEIVAAAAAAVEGESQRVGEPAPLAGQPEPEVTE